MYKILFISNEIQIGGATKSLCLLIKTLKEKYNIIPIVLLNNYGYLSNFCENEKIEYIKLKYKPFAIGKGQTKLRQVIKKFLFPLLKMQYIIFNKIALSNIQKYVDMSTVDLIHTNINRDDFGAMLSKKYQIPHIWHLREFGSMDYECLYFRKNYIKYMNENANYFIAISNVVKNYFEKIGIEKKKIKVVYNGVDLNDNLKKIYKKSEKLKIIFIGGITENKGQIQLIEALNLLPSKIKNNIEVDFYGIGTSTYINFIKNKIKKYNLKNINFKGYINNIDNIIKKYDLGIMCSKFEAFGRVTIEYMANKLITVASNTGASPEIIVNNCGFLYEYGNFKNLAAIINKIYSMTEIKKNEIAENGYNRVYNNFSLHQNVINVMKLYKTILK